MFRPVVFLLVILALMVPGMALAQEAVVATVNDHPITGFDVDQRIKLMKFMGENNPAKLTRKGALNVIIDDFVVVDEAKLGKIDPTEKDVDDRMKTIEKNLQTDENGLKAKLAALGLDVSAIRIVAKAQMAMQRLIQGKYHDSVAVKPADVDKKFAEIQSEIKGKVAQIEADPRRQPIKVISLQEINFPVEGNDPQLLQSRAIEAGQVAQKLTSCNGAKQASAGIFNVQVGKKVEADGRKLPPEMQAQLAKMAIGRALGPIRYAGGIQLLAYCGSRTITPPPINAPTPTREMAETALMNEKYAGMQTKYMAMMRQTAIIEIKDPAYNQ